MEISNLEDMVNFGRKNFGDDVGVFVIREDSFYLPPQKNTSWIAEIDTSLLEKSLPDATAVVIYLGKFPASLTEQNKRFVEDAQRIREVYQLEPLPVYIINQKGEVKEF